jgi:hypothetical protein
VEGRAESLPNRCPQGKVARESQPAHPCHAHALPNLLLFPSSPLLSLSLPLPFLSLRHLWLHARICLPLLILAFRYLIHASSHLLPRSYIAPPTCSPQNKKVILVGFPGGSICTDKHLPSYVAMVRVSKGLLVPLESTVLMRLRQ